MLTPGGSAIADPIADSIHYGTPTCSKIFGQEGHDDQVISCAVDGNGILYTGSLDRKIKAWNIDSGEGRESDKPLCTYTHHLRGIRCVHAHEDKLYSGAGDSFAKMWNLSTNTVEQTFTGHTAQVMAVRCDGTGSEKFLYTGSFDKTARRWDVNTGKTTETFVGHEQGLASLCMWEGIGGKPMLLTSSADCSIKMWDPRTPANSVMDFTGHSKVVTNVVVCGDKLYSGSLDRSVIEWDPRNGTEKVRDIIKAKEGHVDSLEQTASGPITSICASESGMLYTAASNHAKSEQGIVREWNLGGVVPTQTKMIKIGAAIPWCICVSDSKLFVTCDDKMTKMWELKKDLSVMGSVRGGCGAACGGEGECLIS